MLGVGLGGDVRVVVVDEVGVVGQPAHPEHNQHHNEHDADLEIDYQSENYDSLCNKNKNFYKNSVNFLSMLQDIYC